MSPKIQEYNIEINIKSHKYYETRKDGLFEISIAHKTGEIGYFTHDAGIVFSNKGDYIIVVLTESDFPLATEEQIADISKSVNEYFN